MAAQIAITEFLFHIETAVPSQKFEYYLKNSAAALLFIMFYTFDIAQAAFRNKFECLYK